MEIDSFGLFEQYVDKLTIGDGCGRGAALGSGEEDGTEIVDDLTYYFNKDYFIKSEGDGSGTGDNAGLFDGTGKEQMYDDDY